jgi:AcrR family transcriptional regulator
MLIRGNRINKEVLDKMCLIVYILVSTYLRKEKIMKPEKRARLPKEERKIQLMEIALKLFSKNGFDGTKTKKIAEAAGISEAAMFKIFKNKEDLVLQSFDYKFGGHKQAFLSKWAIDKTDMEKNIKLAVMDMYELIEKNFDLFRVMLLMLINHPEYVRKNVKENIENEKRILSKRIEELVESGLIRKIDFNIVGPMLPLVILGTVAGQLLIKETVLTKNEKELVVNQIIDVFLHGIMTNK